LQRSVTEMRMSRSGRPKVSPSWNGERAVIGARGNLEEEDGPAPRNPVVSLYLL
jgi:hypothetical protein